MIQAKSVPLTDPAALTPASVAEMSLASPAPAGKSQRFFHLDALRAALMFWGILVHASTVEHSVIFRAIATVSGLVRMEAFFVISGFLAYMLLKKYGAKAVVRKRMLAIGLPFVTALLLLNPLTNWLVYNYHNAPIPFADYLAGKGVAHPEGPMNWHLHLWFLVALLVYSLLAPLLGRAVDHGLRLSWAGERITFQEGVFLWIGITMAVGCLGSRIAFEIVKPALPPDAHYVVRSVGNFLPFYALGMLLYASPAVREVFSKVHWIQTGLSCALLVTAHRLGGENPSRFAEIMILAAQTYVAVCLSSLLFWVAGKWVRRESATARSLSDAAYSVYLFHFLFLYLFAFLFRPWIGNPVALLAAISSATFLSTLCLHRFVIRRIPVLELLFNGKLPRRAQ